MMRFQKKVALMTGSIGGIGLANPQRLPAKGARLTLIVNLIWKTL